MYQTILFAADFDATGIGAAKKAKKIADENRAKLFMVHVVEPIPAYAYPGFAGFSEVETAIKEQAEKELHALAKTIGVDALHCLVACGSTKNEILKVATEKHVDLIVTGSHGKHGLALLLGSTASAIMHHAECDVLIVRTKPIHEKLF